MNTPTCTQCANKMTWKVNLYLHEPGLAREVGLCGIHVKPFRAQRWCSTWTVTKLVQVVFS